MQKAIFLLLLLIPSYIICQTKFTVKNGSKIYNAAMTVNCADGNCSGEGTITITRKEDKSFKQVLSSEDLYFDLNKDQKPTVNIIQLYNEQSPLIFEDFNFDGHEDLAIRNGNNSGYGGPSYDVYVFNITKTKFVLSKELTALAFENLGMFQTDTKRKRIITFAKSGCCWHITTEYEIVPMKGLHKVYELEEDAMNDAGNSVIVTTRKWINNKLKTEVKKYKTEDYYKE
ncbi:FG-GAP repeat protein [Flavobacterium sp. PL002]|uniref:XAC2610-related protein n=1 Tax=Flavobacterium sp. PL002 TaxID=1897058 RepID=UPI00178863B5|nr:FG-GAP repeat protein [Flavobacterium sp. PL002]MBE0391226.1 hypothetical protein [Flavobacterium sp. PL002]